ncbi:MAG: GTP-binding protein [Bryobacteraceae bacterium]
MSANPWIVPVGGFLGAGKTTLIISAARVLRNRGVRAAAILNDQGGGLVDTAHVRRNGIGASEVAGACFCCRFSELIDAAEELRALSPNVIFAEPVGSCTDLSATILQPLKQDFRDRYRVAPLTVVVDPGQAGEFAQPERDRDLGFLFDKQIGEADIVAFTKCDLHEWFPPLSAPEIRYVSGATGQGISVWLDEVLSGLLPCGTRILDLDYVRYAQAEAALGWLNWSASFRADQPLSASQLVGPLIDNLQRALTQAGAKLAHLKVIDEAETSYLKAAVTNNASEPIVEGDLIASPEFMHHLRVNLRAVLDAPELERIFRSELANLRGLRKDEVLQCFSPSPPQPERRFASVFS